MTVVRKGCFERINSGKTRGRWIKDTTEEKVEREAVKPVK